MRKLFVIIAREYRLRLRRPAFWVLTLLVPLLLAALYAIPVIAAHRNAEPAVVLLVDETDLFRPSITSTESVTYIAMPTLDHARQRLADDEGVDAILHIPQRQTTIPRDAFLYHRDGTPPPALMRQVDNTLQVLLRNAVLEDVYQVEPSVYHSVESTTLHLHARDALSGRDSFAEVKAVMATVLAALMVLALIVFGIQVMRSVQEEKATRVAEVVASSVKPVQLMVGKVAGVALAAVSQMVLWVLLTAAAIGLIQHAAPTLFDQARSQQEASLSVATKGAEATAQYNTAVPLVDEALQGLTAINLPLVASLFALFFLLGYLLYGSLLAALAARLDSDADALQWVLLLLSPLLVTLLLTPLILNAPGGALAAWLTAIPFTAPVAVLQRLPFGIGIGDVALAALLMAVAFGAAALLAARSYKRHLVG